MAVIVPPTTAPPEASLEDAVIASGQESNVSSDGYQWVRGGPVKHRYAVGIAPKKRPKARAPFKTVIPAFLHNMKSS